MSFQISLFKLLNCFVLFVIGSPYILALLFDISYLVGDQDINNIP